ncbi:MAG: hypothetical protein QOI41_7031 [Myxococcales bacterium]|jgi:hypothetical protein|nr:hypothetical protein [Myxococcales bacterium]
MRVRDISAALFASSVVAVTALAAVVACSSSTSNDAPAALGAEGGGGIDAPSESSAEAAPITGPTQKGRIIDALGKTGVAAAVVTVAGQTATTGDDGNYVIGYPKGVPYSMTVTAPDHLKLDEQEWIVKTDAFDRGDTSLLATSTAMFLQGLLPARDPAKGLLAVRIYPLAPCTSEQGATLTLDPPGTSKLTYFKSTLPDKTATSTTKDENFSGVFTDVDTGVPLKVTVTSPDCEQIAFPVDYSGVTLTGQQKAEPGDVISYIRVFIGPTKIADAGTD